MQNSNPFITSLRAAVASASSTSRAGRKRKLAATLREDWWYDTSSEEEPSTTNSCLLPTNKESLTESSATQKKGKIVQILFTKLLVMYLKLLLHIQCCIGSVVSIVVAHEADSCVSDNNDIEGVATEAFSAQNSQEPDQSNIGSLTQLVDNSTIEGETQSSMCCDGLSFKYNCL